MATCRAADGFKRVYGGLGFSAYSTPQRLVHPSPGNSSLGRAGATTKGLCQGQGGVPALGELGRVVVSSRRRFSPSEGLD